MEDIDADDASGLLVPDGTNEDSVDIYDGLDIGFSSNAEKSPPAGSQLKESMDLYEDIVTEEHQNKQSSYNELQARFQAAQNQIKELRRRLEQMEMQNTGLSAENCCLKKNISALLRTARQEVARKDAEIQRLNQRSIKGPHHSHINNIRDQNSYNRNSASRPPPPPPSSSLPPPPPPPSAPPQLPPLPASPPRGNQLPQDPSHLSKGSSHSHSKRDNEVAEKRTESDKYKSKHREEKHQSSSESMDRRHRSPNRGSRAHEKNRSHRAEKDTERRYDSGSHKSRRHHRSDGAKTSSPDILHTVTSSDDKKGSSREQRQDKGKIPTSDSEHSSAKESNTHEHRKVKTSDGHSRSSNSKDRKRSSDDRHRDSSRERDGHRQKDHHRAVDRRREGENSRKHKRTSESEMSKGEEKQRSKESDQVKPEECSKERQEEKPEDLKRPPEEPNVVQKNSVEENSPNRKLCFMETLNLTLSPIKKPVLPMDGSQNDLTPVDKDVENSPDEEKSQPDMEDMCVIDEADTSEFEAGVEEVAEQSPHNLKASSSEQPNDVKDVQEKDKSSSETPAIDSSVQSTSAQSQPVNNAENQMMSGESSSLQAVDSSRNHEDKPSLVSASQVAECEPMGVSHGPDPSNTSGSNDDRKAEPENNTAAVTEATVLNSSADDVPPQPKEMDVSEDVAEKVNQQTPPTVLPQVCPPVPCTSSCDRQDVPKDSNTVSSTISLESVPQEGLSLKEAIFVLTQGSEDSNDSSSITAEPSSSTSCIGVSKVSSTTEDRTLPERYSELTVTPKKRATPVKRHENNQLGSVPLLHDEDSMMRTLSNLKKIPDAISPLRSPVRITKRGLLHVHGKPGHVKSLQKEFSSTVVGAESKLDINKENKYPHSPSKSDAQNMVDNVPSSLSETDLEEGEILSESDEAGTGSPAPATKRAKLTPPVRNKASPKSVSLSKRKCEERRVSPKETAGVSTRSPKSRFKTVCPAASKASFSTVEEIMETFRLVRAEIRKKYMKLHKTFPKKSFYGVMDNFQESFLEFVDGANFSQICSQVGELKSKLRKLIASVFSKVSNNGIVKRIFEQQAVDLKQKLWDFVDGQINYLFKDIHTTLKSLCKTGRPQDRRSSGDEKISKQSSPKKPPKDAPASLNRTMSCPVVPYKTGLGSRGKDIRITHVEKDRNADTHPPSTPTVVEFLPPKNPPSTPEKNGISSLVVSQNASLLDKTDFELLTEQQASSLTFTLVRDSQMGEIFKCLLQGSDLLENSGIAGDNTSWPLGTPRKDGERFISITTPSKFDSPSKLLSPNKFDTPSKLIATWSSISPRKMSSPRQKDQVQLNPDLFDESCLLEVPSANRAGLPSQKSYSILAEDLAVSLTIPSPLKSDSHLSFLQPSSSMSMHIMSTPDSVISAHISEDALLDGEDATEQDIHLALDTDNSSCCSTSSSVTSEPLATPFVFKPDVPMQALVMEKSNDHFILKIRQASTSADVTLTADDTLTEEDQQHREDMAAQDGQVEKSVTEANPCKAVVPENNPSNPPKPGVCQPVSESDTHLLTLKTSPSHKNEVISPQQNTSKGSKESPNHPQSDKSMKDSSQISDCQKEEHVTPQKSPSKSPPCESRKRISPRKRATNHQSQTPRPHVSDSDRDEKDGSEKSLSVTEETSSSPEKEQKNSGRKRKKHQRKSKVKRSKTEEEEESSQDPVMREDEDSNSLSPSSLSAKNLIKKKGEVVVAWTRDEDRIILIDLKTKGASRETFSALSEKLNKPSGQIAQRFHQLMKLFKKQEKMDP